MNWTKSLATLLLLTSISRFGHSRALPAITHTCNADICENSAWSESPLGNPLKNLRSRYDEPYEDNSDDVIAKWPWNEHQLLHELGSRAVAPPIPKPVMPPVVGPSKPDSPSTNPANNPEAGLDPNRPTKPDSPSTDPANNPEAGLDPNRPTKPDSTPDTALADNPEAGLDPNRPKPAGDPSPSPGSDPLNVGPKPSPADNEPPSTRPSLPAADDRGCGMKRADRPCPGPSDNIGDDVPGQAPDTAANTRANRPVDDDNAVYDFLDEVRRERGMGLVNDKLENLETRITDQTPDAPIRNDEINSGYDFDSKKPETGVANNLNFLPLSFDNMFDPKLGHEQFEELLKLAGVALTDTRAVREAVKSPKGGDYTLRISWSGDQKVLFADWSYKKFDNSAMEPKPHFTELMMATLKTRGVDPKNIQAIARTRINNSSTMLTIDSIYKSLKVNFIEGRSIVLSRSDTDQAKKEAFDAFFRTDNGKGTLNLLAFHANEWGLRRPETLILQRPGSGVRSYNALIILA